MRCKSYKKTSGYFVKLTSEMLTSNAWTQLTVTAKALYPELKLEWKGAKANNNGKISLSVRQAAKRLNVAEQTAAKAFYDLQAKGFAIITVIGHPGVHGSASCNLYELTEMPLPGQTVGRQLYRKWKEGHDYEIKKAQANNPKGANGKKAQPKI